jgi:uncharacterized protein (TIGR03083 family)
LVPDSDDSSPGGAPATAPTLDQQRRVLTASVDRLAALVEPLTTAQLRQQAYPTEWTIADVLSHLGSGAVITRGRLDGDVEMQPIWDEWNAKSPDRQAADALQADRELEERLDALTPQDQTQMRFAMGPFDLDLVTFLGFRVNEHVVHTWDIAVTLEGSATIPADAAALVVDTLGMTVGFAGKPTGAVRTIAVRTKEPARDVAIALEADGVVLSAGDPTDAPDLELPSEALIRLVYGRLDPEHTPDLRDGGGDLDQLRQAFPGF